MEINRPDAAGTPEQWLMSSDCRRSSEPLTRGSTKSSRYTRLDIASPNKLPRKPEPVVGRMSPMADIEGAIVGDSALAKIN